ncbi:hypothetical protein Emtol_0247 (plasmid) [Emticicia oligotrophica DSM 17448]|uniref:Uncharacterized protein n=1 Tax=Emticicia oligotrophica (strain DSM 17448 / CIP 109782 / MTCC 6937 / GPTSA100-15) TaxID=929562 RepID=A0ABM5N7I5_EMTOG|nr:hypothetical protein [Emticicia oligotrophica]AFK05517.1 hypothetical protein Emtol_0247 [Emticicia oligotrophica DSM 17448]
MIRRDKYVITSTHLDKQGDIMAKSALDSMLPFLNGERKPRLGLEHIRTSPPFGAVMNGEIVKRQDDHYYLTAEMVYFDKQEIIRLPDGTQLLKEFFSEGEYPFIESVDEEVSKMIIATDRANFEKYSDINDIYNSVKQEVDLEFDTLEFGRKSELPDPETIITITKIIAGTLGIIKSKVTEKLGEAIGEDLVKIYKFFSKLAEETIKKVKPANRPKNFVISYPNTDCNIELVITTHKADRVLTSLDKEKLKSIADKIEQLANLDPEKIQFVYNDSDNWEFNYLLTKSGAVIGTIKSFNKRNELYNQILEKQKKDEKGSS